MSSILTVYRTLEIFFILVAGISFVVIIYDVFGERDAILCGIAYATGAITLIYYIFSVPPKLTKLERFKKFYGFHPRLLSEKTFQIQILAKLLFLVDDLFKIQQGITSHQTGWRQTLENLMEGDKLTKRESKQMEYETTLGEYMSHMELLNHYQPEFAKMIPHWTQLRSFVKSSFETKQYQSNNSNTDYSFLLLLNQKIK